MTEFEHRILIPLPTVQIWAILLDWTRIPQWQPEVSSVEIIRSHTRNQFPSLRLTTVHKKIWVMEVTAWYDSLGYEYRMSRDDLRECFGRWRLRGIPEGTVLASSISYTAKALSVRRKRLENSNVERLRLFRELAQSLTSPTEQAITPSNIASQVHTPNDVGVGSSTETRPITQKMDHSPKASKVQSVPLVAKTQTKRRIFLSYSSRQLHYMHDLYGVLSQTGHYVWYDAELKERGGQKWWDVILAAIRDSDLMIISLTPEWINSTACLAEYEYAKTLGLPVLPIMQVAVPYDLLWADIRHVQIGHYYSTADRANLLESVNNIAMPAQLQSPLPPPPPVPQKPIMKLVDRVEQIQNMSSDEQWELINALERFVFFEEDTEIALRVLQGIRSKTNVITVALDKKIQYIIERSLQSSR